jgi:hypothetical protein
MTVYEVKANVSQFQYFLADTKEGRNALRIDCEPQEETWQPPAMYIYKPKHKRGNFFGVEMNQTIACDQATYDNIEAYELLSICNELLPLPHEGETFWVLNVLECVNCLDRERSEWANSPNKIGAPSKYVFHSNRIPETPLFKIPETSINQILCHEGVHDPTYEFKRRYDRLGLTGLKFTPLWTDDSVGRS